jgi:hypothetical protein
MDFYSWHATLEKREHREILVFGLSYLFALISPHISNRFFIRGAYNMLTGLIVLGTQFKERNVLILGMVSVLNYVLLRVVYRSRRKSQRGLCSLLFNGFATLASALFYDPNDNDLWITMGVFSMKYFYLATESLPSIMQYYEYLSFAPGLLYGPALPYSAYQGFLAKGYLYILDGLDKKTLEQGLGNTEGKSQEEVDVRREDLALREISKMAMHGAACFFASIGIFFLFSQMREAVVPKSCVEPFLAIALTAFAHVLHYVSRWVFSFGTYAACFIPKMGNLRVYQGIPKSIEDIYAMWNVGGMSFVKYTARVLRGEEDGSEKRKRERREKGPEKNKAFVYIRTSLIAFAPILLVSPSPAALAFFPASALFMPLLSEMLPPIAGGPLFLPSLFFFLYFILPFVTSPSIGVCLWWKTCFCGHLLSLLGAVKLLVFRE